MSETKQTSTLLKGETVVDVQKLMNLEASVAAKNQTIGAYLQQVSELKEQIRNKEKQHAEELAKAEKQVTIITGTSSKTNLSCNKCGRSYGDSDFHCCPRCGTSKSDSTPDTHVTNKEISYKNLDDIKDLIQTEELIKAKTQIHELESKALDITFELDKTKDATKKLVAKNKVVVEELNEAANNRVEVERKITAAVKKEYEEAIEKVSAELDKVRADKTDELVEANRKQEIIDLKMSRDAMKKQMEDLEAIIASSKPLQSRLDKKRKERLEKEAIVEAHKDEMKVDTIANRYPTDKSFWDFIKVGDRKVTRPFRTRISSWFNIFSKDPDASWSNTWC